MKTLYIRKNRNGAFVMDNATNKITDPERVPFNIRESFIATEPMEVRIFPTISNKDTVLKADKGDVVIMLSTSSSYYSDYTPVVIKNNDVRKMAEEVIKNRLIEEATKEAWAKCAKDTCAEPISCCAAC